MHINFPFRKPFEPTAADALAIDRSPPAQFVTPPSGGSADLAALTDDLLSRRGIIYCGHGACRSAAERERSCPGRSACRTSPASPFWRNSRPICARPGDCQRLRELIGRAGSRFSQVEVVIRFGGPPLCKAMADFLAGTRLAYHIYCSRAGEWADDTHSLTHHLTINPAAVSADDWDDFPCPQIPPPGATDCCARMKRRKIPSPGKSLPVPTSTAPSCATSSISCPGQRTYSLATACPSAISTNSAARPTNRVLRLGQSRRLRHRRQCLDRPRHRRGAQWQTLGGRLGRYHALP